MIVIGAGVIGCACAYELAAAGARVSVFDVRAIGQGASQASAGVLAPYIEGHETSALRELGRRSLDLYDAFIERLTARSERVLHYTRGGTLEVALDGMHATRLRDSAEALRRDHVVARWLEPVELRRAEPLAAAGALGGLLIEMHGFVAVPDLTNALSAAAMQNGAQFALETRVLSIAPEPNGTLIVETDHGPSRAADVVFAAGSWAGQVHISGVDPTPVRPVRGQLLHLAWPTGQSLRHVLWGTDCYIVPWSNGRVLVGATVEEAGFDERSTAGGVRDLLAAGCALVPDLRDASFIEVRVGLRPASPDDLPVVGRSGVIPGLVYATGHYRNGVLLAPLTAALVRNLIIDDGEDDALDVLSPSRLGRL